MYGANADSALSIAIYQDASWKQVRPDVTIGAGVTSAPSHGLQFHVEVRETFLSLPLVTGPTTTQNQQPPSRSAWKGIPSVLAGFDLALKKQRGRRY